METSGGCWTAQRIYGGPGGGRDCQQGANGCMRQKATTHVVPYCGNVIGLRIALLERTCEVPEVASGILTHRSTNVTRWSGQKTPLGSPGKVQTHILALYLGTPVAGCWDVLFAPSSPLSTPPAPQRYPTNHPATWLHHPAARSAFRSTAVPLVRCPISGFEEDTKFCTYESPTKVHTLEDGH
jgi:hypothetical protein